MIWNGQGEVIAWIIEMVNMHLILPIEQRQLKASSSEKNLNVFKREEYYTNLPFPQHGRKGYMELRVHG